MKLTLPFPPAILSGHANGNGRWKKIKATKEFRQLARNAVIAYGGMELPEEGDIRIVFHFYPPDRRGDRYNFMARAKSICDGIADGLGVNDRRFLPYPEYHDPKKPGCVIVEVG